MQSLKTSSQLLVVSGILVLNVVTSSADLVLNLTDGGGSTVNFHAFTTGSNKPAAAPVDPPAIQTGPAAFFPGAAGWFSGINFDNDLGDILSDFSDSENDGLALSSGISFKVDGVQVVLFDDIDLDPSVEVGKDDIEVGGGGTPNILYPNYTTNSEISWAGMGTFTLNGAPPFDEFAEVFTDGTYSKTTNGITYTVGVGTGAVADPNAGPETMTYDDWEMTAFTEATPPADRAPERNPEFDDYTNGMEYLTGGDPEKPDPPTFGSETMGDDLVVTYRRSKSVPADAEEYQIRDELDGIWKMDPAAVGTKTEIDAQFDLVTVKIPMRGLDRFLWRVRLR